MSRRRLSRVRPGITFVSMSASHIVWVDCEMTGLSLVHDALIELAVLVTDDELNVLGEGVDVVIRPPDAALEQMDEFVRNMHTKSALLDELSAAPPRGAPAGPASFGPSSVVLGSSALDLPGNGLHGLLDGTRRIHYIMGSRDRLPAPPHPLEHLRARLRAARALAPRPQPVPHHRRRRRCPHDDQPRGGRARNAVHHGALRFDEVRRIDERRHPAPKQVAQRRMHRIEHRRALVLRMRRSLEHRPPHRVALDHRDARPLAQRTRER